MELDELYEFPEFSRDPTMYLALRNLILASWNKNCKVRRGSISIASSPRDKKRNIRLQKKEQTMSGFSCFSKGGADFPEMRSEHHCPGFGACALRAGDGPSAPVHDQEGSHQHRCAGCETASAPWQTLRGEFPHLYFIMTQQCTSNSVVKALQFLPTFHHFYRRMSSSSVPGLQVWLLRDSCKTSAPR